MMSLWDALRMNMMISYQELVRTFLSLHSFTDNNYKIKVMAVLIPEKKRSCYGLLFLLYKRI
ncbi:TPA: hypothetical protein HH828_003630 [Escherichia coli]|nr:hypothetical protein PCN061_0316 [Escherichia coli PCN061]APA27606.1 hypothetical protein ATO45_20415 [Escherichia coli]RUL57267.1 hypothetical protein ELP95_09370 [Shigella sonnei]THI95566.1 hypothetical protein FAZ87_22035 [Escherichia coli K-12]EEW8175378.1 hypothetical protein [Escherichia coli]